MKSKYLPLIMLSGCLHHPGVHPCSTSGKEVGCWESKRLDENNQVRHKVVEKVIEGDPCELVVIEQTSFNKTGNVIHRIIDEKRCRVVDKRIEEKYDHEKNVVIKITSIDDDHNDHFDRILTETLDLKK